MQPPSEAVIAALNAYGAAHADEFGGLYLDDATGGVVVLFTQDVAAHEAAIHARLGPAGAFTIRQVRWSEAELRALQDRLVTDRAWFESVGAKLSTAGVDVISNVATATVSSRNAEIEQLALEHFAAQGKLRVQSDGTGVLFLAPGAIAGRVVDRAGRPVANADVEYSPLFDAGPIAGVGHASRADGSFLIEDVIPGQWRVEVWSEGRAVASSQVAVPPGGVGTVTITLAAPLPAP